MWREPTGWAGTRVGAGHVPTGPDVPGRARRRTVPGFGGSRAVGGFGSSDRLGDAFGEGVAVAQKQYADGDRKQGPGEIGLARHRAHAAPAAGDRLDHDRAVLAQQRAASCGRSDPKPYPGCSMSQPALVAAVTAASTSR